MRKPAVCLSPRRGDRRPRHRRSHAPYGSRIAVYAGGKPVRICCSHFRRFRKLALRRARMIIGDRLRELREGKSLSQGDIEKRTGLLRCYISRVENGHTVPAIETLEKMARAQIGRASCRERG